MSGSSNFLGRTLHVATVCVVLALCMQEVEGQCTTIDNCLDCSDAPSVCNSCVAGFGVDASNQCSHCGSNCLSCTKSGEGNCNLCTPGNTLTGTCSKTCTSVDNCLLCPIPGLCTACMSGYGIDDASRCSSCGTHCKSCIFAANCIFCDEGFSLDIMTGTCVACGPNCSSCVLFGAGKCDLGFCTSGTSWNLMTQQCA